MLLRSLMGHTIVLHLKFLNAHFLLRLISNLAGKNNEKKCVQDEIQVLLIERINL